MPALMLTNEWIVGLHGERDAAPEALGGKAHRLRHLARAGFRVPPGFCITAAAFRHFCAESLPEALVAPALVALARGEPLRPWAEALRERILTASFPPALESAIRSALAELAPAGAVAVRSSALSEDTSEASSAGQLDSFLGVSGAEEVLERVRACWASAFAERALAYRATRQPASASAFPDMGVLVQELVAADVSGVLFTRNPTGSEDEMAVDAHPGLGEPLLSGRVSPDHFVLPRVAEGPALPSARSVARKTQALVFEAGELLTVEVPADRRDAPCLCEAELDRLAQLGRRIEQHFDGSPQDVEWCLREETLFVLQARPITAVAAPLATRETGRRRTERAWTNMNVGEAVPGVLSPLAFGFLERFLLDAIFSTFESIGLSVDRADSPVVSLRGRVYVDLVKTVSILSQIPGFSPSHLRALGGEFERLDLVAPRQSRAGFLLRFPRRLPGFLLRSLRLPARLRRASADVSRWAATVQARDLSALPTAELGRMLERHMLETRALIDGWLACAGNGELLYVVLEKLFARWLGAGPAELNRVMSGITGLKSAEPAAVLWLLARRIAAHPTLVEALERSADLDGLRRALVENPRARAVADDLQAFLREYGHRCNNELDLMATPWREDPGFVLDTLRIYARMDEGDGPRELEQKRLEERQRALREMAARLPFWKRALVRRLLEECWKSMRLREEGRFHMVRGFDVARRLVRAAGARLVEERVLSDAEDVFFLTPAELDAALAGQGSPAATGEVLAARRREHEHNRSLPAPPSLLLDDEELPVAGEPSSAVRFLRGLPASSGRVTGRARVLLDPADCKALQPGEILVTDFADVSWTPLLFVVKALVMDVGGALSHVAVVAREYGVPAVVNVVDGTRRIRDGQTITVDGERGIVWLAEEEQPADLQDVT